jgi:hypothetical protein
MAHRMAHIADRAQLGKHALERVESALMLGVIGGGLLACAIGAFIYDMGRLFAVW